MSEVIFIGAVFSVFLYACITLFVAAIKSSASKAPIKGNAGEGKFISIIVPVRNEAQNIDACLKSCLQQNYPSDKFEIIVVDDDSEDQTRDKVSAATKKHHNLKLLKTEAFGKSFMGKKNSIRQGIDSAAGEIIFTTDGDCIVPPDHLKTIHQYFSTGNVRMVCGAVDLSGGKGFFALWQQLEFSALMTFTEVFIKIGKPIMCNGANLSFLKSGFDEVGGYDNNMKKASGDDVFMLMKFKRRYGAKSIVYSSGAPVTTAIKNNVFEFFSQRKRWASKVPALNDPLISVIALVVFSANFFQLICFLLLLYKPSVPLLMVITLKLLVDLIFFLCISKPSLRLLRGVLGGQFINMIYVPVTAVASVFGKYKWKGRSIS
jgi:poly-beta-1,6-N-acetyl-D-glucosamine synthase